MLRLGSLFTECATFKEQKNDSWLCFTVTACWCRDLPRGKEFNLEFPAVGASQYYAVRDKTMISE